MKIRNSWCKNGTRDLGFILFLRIPVCIIFQQSPLHAYVESEMNGTEQKKKKIEIGISFFGIHVMTLVRMCGFEASDHVDLRADCGIFAATKW